MEEKSISENSVRIAKKFYSGYVVSAEILNAQKMSSDQVAPPYRMSPYVAIVSYTTEWPSKWDDKFVKTIKRKGIPKMLKELGKEKPRQEMIFWNDKNFYLEKFR